VSKKTIIILIVVLVVIVIAVMLMTNMHVSSLLGHPVVPDTP
jgi:hypothetical protein